MVATERNDAIRIAKKLKGDIVGDSISLVNYVVIYHGLPGDTSLQRLFVVKTDSVPLKVGLPEGSKIEKFYLFDILRVKVGALTLENPIKEPLNQTNSFSVTAVPNNERVIELIEKKLEERKSEAFEKIIDKMNELDLKNPPRLLKPTEAAAMLRVSLTTVHSMLEDRTISGKKIGRQWRISSESVKAYMRTMEVAAEIAEAPAQGTSGSVLNTIATK